MEKYRFVPKPVKRLKETKPKLLVSHAAHLLQSYAAKSWLGFKGNAWLLGNKLFKISNAEHYKGQLNYSPDN